MASLERTLAQGRGRNATTNNVVAFDRLPPAVGQTPIAAPIPMDRALVGRTIGVSGVSSAQARVRRRNVLYALCGLAAVTFLMGITAGGNFMRLFIAVFVMLVVYVAMMLQYQREVEANRTSVLRVGPPLLHDSDLVIEPEPDLTFDDELVYPGEVVELPTEPHLPAFRPERVPVPLAATGTETGRSVYVEDDVWASGAGFAS